MSGKPVLQCILLILSVCILTTCSEDPNESGSGDVVIADNVSVIPNETWNKDFISMDSTNYTLTFSEDISPAMKIRPGDILISAAGEGLLRKVTSVNKVGSNIEVKTEFASLVDAIEQGDLELDQPLYTSQIKSIEYHVPGLKFKSENSKGSTAVDFLWEINSILYDSDNNPGTISDQIKLTGDFSFKWNLVTKIRIGLLQGLKEIKFGLAASENLNLNLAASIAYQLPDNLDLVLATIRFSPIYVYIGGIPVVLNPVLKIHVGIEGNLSATITTGISQGLSFSAGIHYLKSKGWSPYQTFENHFTYNWPEIYINSNVTAYLKPEFEMKVYGVGGPYVNMKLYGRFASQLFPNPKFRIYGGISLGAGARIEIFDKYELDYAIDDIFKKEFLIYKDSLQQAIQNPVVTSGVGSFTSTSAIMGGDVKGDGGSKVTECGIYWGTSPDPVNSGTKLSIGSGTGNFSINIQNLTPNTTYYIIAFATNTNGTGFGDEKNFTTLDNLVAVDVDGNTYNTVTIGSQVWFSENLRVTRLNDGEAIPLVSDNIGWEALSTPGYCWYNNNQSLYGSNFGALYNWFTINTNKLCPAGWHVPGDNDFKNLEKELGMSTTDADATGLRGTNEGSKMAGRADLWADSSLDSNVSFGMSGFNAVPGGHRYYEGDFQNINTSCVLYSSTESSEGIAWYRQINYNGLRIERNTFDKRDGFSVRCLRD
ncbi:MAG: fibrobacter succinogenes major paralogous domain-containing protein [Bacteroidales bacterium]|nr:fibrobacter succinogenes major paralogous domain-containing protein [Bacteroidales bacterium]